MARERVVIVGGGFAGLYAARALRDSDVEVTLVDRRNHHLFQPLLYQVATAALNPSEIAAPIRGIVHGENIEVLLADVTAVDLAAKRLQLDRGTLDYDRLIIATGATHSYFGHPEWERFAPGLKTIEDALEIRRRVLLAYEEAEREEDTTLQQEWLTFVIIGGGPTGVEMAGALAEISREALRGDFKRVDPSRARILLVEGLPHLLSAYPEKLSEQGRVALERLGVEVRTSARVTGIDARGVSIGADRIAARTVVWAAGVAASPLARSLGVPLDRAGRVKVTPELTLPGREDVFVVGDLASLDQDGKPVPGLAPAAMQEGTHAAKNILRRVRGEAMQPFRYFDRGSFAVIGRGRAVGVVLGRFRMSGVLAWLAWLFIHLLFLIGFRSRVVVLINWAYAYVNARRGVRLITYEQPLGSADETLSPKRSHG